MKYILHYIQKSKFSKFFHIFFHLKSFSRPSSRLSMISKGSSDISMEFGMVKHNDEMQMDDENEQMAIFDVSKPRYL